MNNKSLNVIQIRDLINNSNTKNNYTNVNIICIHTICDEPDVFRSILIFFKELLNNSKANVKKLDGLLNTLKFVHICPQIFFDISLTVHHELTIY
jgi:hypothetical protein